MAAPLLCPASGGVGPGLVWTQHLCFWRRMGTRFKDEMWMSKDPCGLLCSTFVHWLIFAAGYCVNANVLKPWLGYMTAGVINSVVFNALLFLALVVRPLASA